MIIGPSRWCIQHVNKTTECVCSVSIVFIVDKANSVTSTKRVWALLYHGGRNFPSSMALRRYAQMCMKAFCHLFASRKPI